MSGRLTITEQIVHYSDETQQPTEFSPPHLVRALKSDAQPYGPRHLVIGEEWQPLEVGWLKDVELGMLVIINREGVGLPVQPTAEEREEIRGRVIQIAIEPLAAGAYTIFTQIKPGRSVRFDIWPANIRRYVLRCVKGSAKCTLMLYPE